MIERDNSNNDDKLSKIVTTEYGITYRILKFPKSTFDVVIADREAFFAELEAQQTGQCPSPSSLSERQ